MDETTAAATGLQPWLRAEVGLSGPIEVSQIAGGWSNVTSLVTDETGRRVVVRQPPAGHVGGGAHDVLREARIVGALRDTPVPVPVVLASCDDAAVVGQPFYVMEFAEGEVLGSTGAATRIAPEYRRELGFALIDVLADLQSVGLESVGLADLRRHTPYPQRQLRRWRAQWDATADRSVPAVEHVADRLEARIDAIAPAPEVLVHQDFRFGNVMVVAEPRPRITALLDWELATTGHPLADLGFLGARIGAPAEVLEGDGDPLTVAGYPSFDELAAHFSVRSGIPIDDLPLFVAMSAWRWAIIVEGIRQRLLKGAMGESDQSAEWHGRRVELLAEFAADLLR